MAASADQQTPALSSQETIDNFWKANLTPTKAVGKPPSVLPPNVYAQLVGENAPKGEVEGRSVNASYEEAVKECEAKVAQIVAECKRNNRKYTDIHFDLDDFDFCLRALSATSDGPATTDSPPDAEVTYDVTQRGTSSGGPIYWGNIQPDSAQQQQGASDSTDPTPACAKRVGDIFDDPKFYVGAGPEIKDIRQGAEGDCWFLSALGCLCVDEETPKLIERLCPPKARNEKVGVYGFVFVRDGEWISEVVDDKLYLNAPDYDDCDESTRAVWDRAHFKLDPELSREEYRKTYQINSDALFFGSCAHPDETWVPLLEKAFAKAHGDFAAIDGGFPGEGVEDLTGGITTSMDCTEILDKDEFWTESCLKVNKEFILAAGTKEWSYPDKDQKGRQGIEDGHAYSVLNAVEYDGNRLLQVKNPWGISEWNGPWSDGSKEWTAEALKVLNYKFGNDGIFWMPYKDFLRRYETIWRTRLFTHDWNVTQHWTTVQVPWLGDFNDTKFEFVLPKPSRTVVVLSELDSRFFQGLTGRYFFDLAFRLHHSGDSVHIVRGYSSGNRSAVTEIDLEAGTYEVLLQISGLRDDSLPKVEDVVKQNWLARRKKLVRTGLSYDLANARGQTEEEGGKKESSVINDTVAPAQAAAVAPDVPSGDAVAPSSGLGAAPDAAPAPADAPVDAPADASQATTVEPWNATCVVGLRVFCQETAAKIRVVRPKTGLDKLDVDDAELNPAEKAVPQPAAAE